MKQVIILFLFVLFSQTLQAANTAVDCKELPTGLPLAKMPNWLPKIAWFGASSEQIKNAFCRNHENLDDEAIENYFKQKYVQGGSSAELAGLKIENDNPQLIALLKKLTVIPDRASGEICVWCKNRLDQKIYKAENCTSVLCAAKAAFGNQQGLRMLYLLDRYGFNSSADIYKDASPWTVKELDHIIKTFGDLPHFMLPIYPNKKFTHFTRGSEASRGDLEIIANASMEFYSGYDHMKTQDDKSYTIVHEWGHNLGKELRVDSTKEWLDLSGWVDKGGDWKATRANALVSEYAATNPSEDFAESVATYRYNPTLLQTLNPEKYQFIKEVVFQGMEYLNTETCDENRTYVNKLLANAPSLPTVTSDLATYSDCRQSIMGLLAFPAPNPSLVEDCMQKIISTKRLNEGIKQIQNVNYPDTMKRAVGVYHWDVKKLELGPEELIKTQNELRQQFSGKIADAFAINCKKKTDWKSRFMGQDKRCDSISAYSYQDAKGIGEAFGDDYLTLSHRQNYEAFIKRLCLGLDKKVLNSCGATEGALKESVLKNLP